MNSQTMKEPMSAFDGEWGAVEVTFAGQRLPETEARKIKLILKDGNYAVGNDRGLCRIDSSVTPNAIEIIGVEGPNQGKTIPAIYELDGDALKVCYDLSCGKRPEEFASEAGTQLLLIDYRRERT